ncbi:MAG: hypothetical protein SFZ03_00130 [Candidatus Melainabacteria bacterium]|nr:hypothetical protein [Candidatus Melainabacteria bacterium]
MACFQRSDGTFACYHNDATHHAQTQEKDHRNDTHLFGQIAQAVDYILPYLVGSTDPSASVNELNPVILSELSGDHQAHLLFYPRQRRLEVVETPRLSARAGAGFESPLPSPRILNFLSRVEQATGQPIQVTSLPLRPDGQRLRSLTNPVTTGKSLPQWHKTNVTDIEIPLVTPQSPPAPITVPVNHNLGFIQEDTELIHRQLSFAKQPINQAGKSGHIGQAETIKNKFYLNRRQKLLNKLYGGPVFDAIDLQYPYDYRKGQRVEDPNIRRLSLIADWIIGRQQNGDWHDAKVSFFEQQLSQSGRLWLSPEIQRQLDIARKLHLILKQNEAVSFQRDDAKAFADGMQVLIDANTHRGKVDENQLIKDIHFFAIDQGPKTLSHMTNMAKESNAAYNLLAGPRLGTIGWDKKYWDHGQQYEIDKYGNKKLINQAHHFAFFFSEALDSKKNLLKLSGIWYGARVIDPVGNTQDVELGRAAAQIAVDIQFGKKFWNEVPSSIYQTIKTKE